MCTIRSAAILPYFGLYIDGACPVYSCENKNKEKKERMFDQFRKFETTLAGRPLVVETGKMAQLAGGSVLIRYGETEVLCTATMSDKPREGVDFFPMSIDFEEKLYSVGKIPGSFQRREGRASEKAILAARVIDRPIRPLFPKDMRNDVGIVATVMSVDPDCLPEITAMIGVSIALSISPIPWAGPISGVSVGLVDGKFVINPTAAEREKSEMAVTVASTDELIAMIEAGANEIDNDTMFDAIMFGHKENQRMVEFIKGIQAEIGKPKVDFPSNDPSHEMYEAVKEFAIDDVKAALDTDDKRVRDERLLPIYAAVHEKFDEQFPEETAKLDDCLYKLQKYIVRRWLLDEGKRVDGRGIDDMRPLNAQVDLLSRVHGSGMFTRGQTQVLTVTTLGTIGDAQLLDGIDEEESKRYIHHYNFPSYSVGGISCGLVTEGDRFMTMVDIQGLEDFFGDMDFKVGGTKKGITAIQMDTKVHGLTPEIVKEAFEKTYKARCKIIDEVILPCIPEPRAELSKYAPKMLTTKIDPEKIGDVIGKQGKVIQKICAECDCKIDIDDDGSVFIASTDLDNAKKALSIVETIAKDPEVGAIYKGVVTRLMSFGAFVEIAPGKEGLVHISHLDVKHTEKVEDVVNVGDEIIVQVLPTDEQGRLNLSRRNALIAVEGLTPENDISDQARKPQRRDGGFRGNRNGKK